jgi:hypothetical protein
MTRAMCFQNVMLQSANHRVGTANANQTFEC